MEYKSVDFLLLEYVAVFEFKSDKSYGIASLWNVLKYYIYVLVLSVES